METAPSQMTLINGLTTTVHQHQRSCAQGNIQVVALVNCDAKTHNFLQINIPIDVSLKVNRTTHSQRVLRYESIM